MSKDTIETLQAQVAELELKNKTLQGVRDRVCVKKLMANADDYIDKTICVTGWVRTIRKGGGGKFSFVKIYDGTTGYELQVIVQQTVPGFTELCKSSNGIGTSVFCTGLIVPSKGREQKIEMNATSVEVVGPCDAAKYPLAGKGLSLEYLRQTQHLRPRTVVLGAIARIRNTLAYATHNFFQESGFQYVHTPLITASDCEGGGEMFQITTLIKDGKIDAKLPNGKIDFSQDFFKRPAYLTVSGQLNAEIYATALSSVYTFGPTFRAEDSHTTRHLSEFWMIEPEIAFADNDENMDVAEAYLKFTIQAVLTRNGPDMKILEDFEVKTQAEKNKALKKELKAARGKGKGKGKGGKKQATPKDWRAKPLRERLQNIVDSSFARVTYTEAIDILQKAVAEGQEFEEKVEWGIDLPCEMERFLCEAHFKKPTIVVDYPKEIKAFYMRMNEDKKTVAAMDILVPGVGELIGGSQREDRVEALEERMKELGLDPEDYSWYCDLRRYGSVPHSGFGAGFERLVCYTTGIDNIRDVIPFPRYPGHADY